MTTTSPDAAPRSHPRNPRKTRPWIRRIALFAASALGALIVLGILGEKILVWQDARRYPPPGELFDVGGHRLHLYCTGEGSPTVILESGLCRDSLDWSAVQPGLSTFTRVCSYDRAGVGWSEPGPNARTSRNIAQELHQLLGQATIEGPLVMVGHSAGGSHVEIFQHLYPERVAGLVLVDVAHVEARPGPPRAMIAVAHVLRVTGAARWLGLLDGSDLPKEAQAIENTLVYRPHFLSTMVAENEAVPETLRQVAAIESPGHLGDLPFVILTAAGPPELAKRPPGMTLEQFKDDRTYRHKLQREMLTFSSNSRQIMANSSGHQIHKDQPELVINAVRELAARIRAGDSA